MYSNLSQQANIYADNVRNEVVSATLGTNEYICYTENCSYTPIYDANGNVTEYVSDNGNVAAQYKYSAFGEIISQSGELFTHRFSTKPYCPTTGLIEYQFRKYDPALGRRLSRDPIEEAGGLNLYAFCGNSIMGVDVLGYIGMLSGNIIVDSKGKTLGLTGEFTAREVLRLLNFLKNLHDTMGRK